jgi:hypothetical protein
MKIPDLTRDIECPSSGWKQTLIACIYTVVVDRLAKTDISASRLLITSAPAGSSSLSMRMPITTYLHQELQSIVRSWHHLLSSHHVHSDEGALIQHKRVVF